MILLKSCPLCKDSNLVPFSMRIKSTHPHISRTKCQNCNIVFANPMAIDTELKNYYENYYDKGNYLINNEKDNTLREIKKITTMSRAEFIKNYKDKLDYFSFSTDGRKKILDIGCGLGKNLIFPFKLDYEIQGTEYDPDAINFVKKNFPNAQFKLGSFSSADYQHNYFDYVVLYHVIEHVLDPDILIHQVCEVLRPGGLLILGTPNMNSFFYIFIRLIEKFTFRIPGIYGGLEHTFLFNRKNLSNLLKKNDFSILKHVGESTLQLKSLIISNNKLNLRKKIIKLTEAQFKLNQLCIAQKNIQ